jgi:hypothetical protein
VTIFDEAYLLPAVKIYVAIFWVTPSCGVISGCQSFGKNAAPFCRFRSSSLYKFLVPAYKSGRQASMLNFIKVHMRRSDRRAIWPMLLVD